VKIAIGLALGAIALTLSAQPHPDCTYDPGRVRDERQVRAELSRLAERVAPNAATTGKRRSVAPPDVPPFPVERNFVDVEIFGRMKRDGIRPAALATDTEFLRRVTIDLAGRIPTPDEVHAFLADSGTDKRGRAIDRLLADDSFNDRWTLWFGDLVQAVQSANGVGQGVGLGRDPYHAWIRAAFANRKPYDVMVRELLASSGDQRFDGAVNYLVRLKQLNGPVQDTFDNGATQSGAQFLAMPLNCISCHDGAGHLEPVNRGLAGKKRYELWQMAAFFARADIRPFSPVPGKPATWLVSDKLNGAYLLQTNSGNKSVRQPLPGQSITVTPAYLGGGTANDGEGLRAAYARMLTADPQFARAAVNYLWKELFGLGIVEPADSFDLARLRPESLPAGVSLQPTHPALLEQLATTFRDSGYDIRALLRLLASSSAYQLSARYQGGTWNESWTPYFARHFPRRLLAEVMLDALHQATGRSITLRMSIPGEEGTISVNKAIALSDTFAPLSLGDTPYSSFLTDFGMGNRDTVPRSGSPSLLQALTIMNAETVMDGVHRVKANNVSAILAATRDPAEIARRLYFATLSRPPQGDELAKAIAYLQEGKLEDSVEDLQYVLLNKLEFLYN
jgi:hypothetical protein